MAKKQASNKRSFAIVTGVSTGIGYYFAKRSNAAACAVI
jgi:short-subunit dehydrogenase